MAYRIEPDPVAWAGYLTMVADDMRLVYQGKSTEGP